MFFNNQLKDYFRKMSTHTVREIRTINKTKKRGRNYKNLKRVSEKQKLNLKMQH